MNTLFSTFETNVDTFLDGFLVYLAKRYRTDLAKTRADWASYKKGTLELMDDPKSDPVATAKQITKLTDEESSSSSSEEEIKTRVEGLDSEGPESEGLESEKEIPIKTTAKTPVKPKAPVKKEKIVVEEESSESDSEEVEIGVKEESSEVEDSSEPVEESEAPPPKKGKKIVVQEESEESSESIESEAPPPKKKVEKKPVEKKPAAKKSAAMQLSDTPKSKDLTPPKGVKFVKGTNNVVFKDKVVAMFTKNGIVPLGTVQIKALTTKEYPYEKWDAAKIKKTWK